MGGVAISWEAVWSCLAGSRVGDSRLMWGKEERCYLLWRIEKGLASRAAVPRSAHYPARNQRIHSASLVRDLQGSRHDDGANNRSAIYCNL